MRKVLFTYILFVVFNLDLNSSASAQTVPSGFKYQTTVRDVFGSIVSSQSVQLRFSFYSGSPAGMLQWQETHLLNTDVYGLVTIVLGAGTSTGAGASASFNLVNWSSNNFYLKVAIDATGGTSYADMGTSQLFSVPYAFYSLKSSTVNNVGLSQFADVNLAGIAVGKLLKWNGSYWIPSIDNDSDTVLFSYTSSHSNTSDTADVVLSNAAVDSIQFAYQSDSSVYANSSGNSTNSNSANFADTALYAFNTGPSAWMRTGNTIAATSKYIGTNDLNNFVIRSNNLERIRIGTSGSVFIRTPIYPASLSISGNDGLYAIGTFGTGSFSSSGAGTKLLWISSKGAFRAGYVNATQWDTVNVGAYSMAAGSNNKAGIGSVSIGESCITGDYSVAMGRKSKALPLGAYPGGNSVALGDSCSSISVRCVTIGRGNYVDINSTIVSIGNMNYSTGAQSLALGSFITATGHWSTVIGYHGSSNSKNGPFVFSDASSSTTFNATIAHQFIARASGGVIFYSDSARTMGITLAAGGGSWASVSDRNKKENFNYVNSEDVLKQIENLKIKSWNYKSQNKSIRHIGPIAQDFYNAFHVGENNISITSTDIDGVILLGIQGLNKRIEELFVLNSINELNEKIKNLNNTSDFNNRLDKIEAQLNSKK